MTIIIEKFDRKTCNIQTMLENIEDEEGEIESTLNPDADTDRITELDLLERSRNLQHEKGRYVPQLCSTLAVSIGACVFGIIINWAAAALYHMDSLQFSVYNKDADYMWLVCYGLIGATAGVIPWAFLTERMGRKSTLIFQSSCLLICWFVKAYFDNYKIYTIAHGFSGFFGICYMFTGEAYLIETVHRKHLKTMFIFFRSSFILGVIFIGTAGSFLSRIWLCGFGAALTALTCVIMCILPESPVFLLPRSEPKADKALRFYLGKNNVSQEVTVIRRFAVFLVTGPYNRNHLLSTIVVKKTMLIVCVLQILSATTGYYALLLDAMRIFMTTSTKPSLAFAVFGCILYAASLIGTTINMRLTFGIKIPLIVSTCLNTIVLTGLGITWYYNDGEQANASVIFVAMCIYGITYEMGLGICPEILLYDYSPYQIYDYLTKMRLALHWALVTANICIYMVVDYYIGIHWLMWIMACMSGIGCLFITKFVVESKGKTLANIQSELGGNPAGNRGSRLNRLASPFDQEHDFAIFQNIIRESLQY